MNLLLHTCCAPCLIHPYSLLLQDNISVTGYFFNPNIHPFKEFKRRLSCLDEYLEDSKIPFYFERDYGFFDYSRLVVFNEEKRCDICYDLRLNKTVAFAKKNGFSAFSTTLLYSRYQNHLLLKEKCEKLSSEYDIDFYYRDFRKGWQQGIDLSISHGFYRQPYCGCIYSEQDRYDKKKRKKQ